MCQPETFKQFGLVMTLMFGQRSTIVMTYFYYNVYYNVKDKGQDLHVGYYPAYLSHEQFDLHLINSGKTCNERLAMVLTYDG